MELAKRLNEEILRLAEQAAAERGLEEEVGDEALITIIEEIAVAVGDAVAQAIIRRKLEADSACADPHCPECGERGLRKGGRDRTILTRRGEVEFTEPECYCRRCRRSFFPSVAGVGAGRGL